jgi:hypothetical protein
LIERQLSKTKLKTKTRNITITSAIKDSTLSATAKDSTRQQRQDIALPARYSHLRWKTKIHCAIVNRYCTFKDRQRHCFQRQRQYWKANISIKDKLL